MSKYFIKRLREIRIIKWLLISLIEGEANEVVKAYESINQKFELLRLVLLQKIENSFVVML